MDPDVSSLLDSPAFAPGLRALARRGVARRYRKGTVLIQEGDVGDMLYIVASGRVKACANDARGREVTYGVYGPGEYLGEMSLDGGPRSATVITLEASICIGVTRQTLLAHIAEHPEFAMELLAKVIGRARMATRTARDLALLDAYGRLAALLDQLAQPDGEGTRVIREPMTHQALASRLGCSREMVSRLVKDLEAGGYLRTRPRPWRVCRTLPTRW